MNDREARKKALEAAKQRLELRKKQKQKLNDLRQQKEAGLSLGAGDSTLQNDYGKQLIDDTKQLMQDWDTAKQVEQKINGDEKQAASETGAEQTAKQVVPGARADLNIVHSVNVVDVVKRGRVEYVKEVQTDSVEIGQHSKVINEETTNDELNEILATFMENEVTPWPSKKDDVYKRITVQSQAEQKESGEDKDATAAAAAAAEESSSGGEQQQQQQQQQQQRRRAAAAEVLVLSQSDAEALVAGSEFKRKFKQKSKIIEFALGINEEHSVFIEAHTGVRGIKETGQMEKLSLLDVISSSGTHGRAITWLEFDPNTNQNRFLVSFAGSLSNDAFNDGTTADDGPTDDAKNESGSDPTAKTDDTKNGDHQNGGDTSAGGDGDEDAGGGGGGFMNIESDGLIHLFEFDRGAQKYVLRRTLECQSMINCVRFHPNTSKDLVIGASVSGQVLGWDLHSQKKTPSIRTEFAASASATKSQSIRTEYSSEPKEPPCHTQPVFALKFLPSMSYMPSTKITQILTLSNDGKLCIWRDDMMSQPINDFMLKLFKPSSSDVLGGGGGAGAMGNQPKEITTTCLSYPKWFGEQQPKFWLGSDEGCIYEANLSLNANATLTKKDEKEILITRFIGNAHHGPITNICFHSCTAKSAKADYGVQSGLYLTSSFDWTVKLWHVSSTKCIAEFNHMDDYIYDVQWSPTNPSIFAVVDGRGNLTLFDLNRSFEHPASEPTSIAASEKQEISITKVSWSPNGKQIIVGDSNGKLTVFDCPVYDPTDADFEKLEEIIRRRIQIAE